MKALILNSGLGTRMNNYTKDKPKCMTVISDEETILYRQLKSLISVGINDVVITTGPFSEKLEEYTKELGLNVSIDFIWNERYQETNYVYSIYKAIEKLDDDIVLLHGDLVFEQAVLELVVSSPNSCMVVSSKVPIPEKDFKAVVKHDKIEKIGVEFFDSVVAAQPMYLLKKNDLNIWMEKITEYINVGNDQCYAENAFNEISSKCELHPIDIGNLFCQEIDCEEDLKVVAKRLKELPLRTVYMSFSSDIIHSGHIAIINKAAQIGKLTIGLLSDKAISTYKRFPLLQYDERYMLFSNLKGVESVVPQKVLSYKDNILKYKPDFVVHGDDWKEGLQKGIRQEVIEILNSYGGQLVEFPYADDEKYHEIERSMKKEQSTPDIRRGRLKKLLNLKKLVTALEAHSGITGLIVENTAIEEDGGGIKQFDAMWISSLCDSTAKGKPDIELVDMTSRFRTIDDICEVTTKPIIFDGDTGGLTEHFVYTVRSLERMGVSMVIIEDKKGLKKNSLFGNDVPQTQAAIEEFVQKIEAGKKAQRTDDFMICARIESLILEKGLDDALKRASAYVEAGADAIMIHSRKSEPTEIVEFVTAYRKIDADTPIVVVPTSFNSVYEEEFEKIGVNIVIYANQLTRTGFPAMQNAAKSILENHRAKECDEICMPFKEIIRLIPEE